MNTLNTYFSANRLGNTSPYIPCIKHLFFNKGLFSTRTEYSLSQAYQEILLDESSQKYTTISTHKGLFQYLRLPFGISSAPAIFQRIMESILQGLPNVCVYIDNILVAGRDHDDHLHNLAKVLDRLEKAGLTLKKSKCVFAVPLIEYLGHVIDAQGLHPSPSKMEAIRNAPTPTSVTELKSFLMGQQEHTLISSASDQLFHS